MKTDISMENVPAVPALAKRTRVSGIDRALQILDHLQETGTAQSAITIAKAVGAPVSTTYVVIEEMVQRQLLVRNPASEVWIGPRLYRYGLSYASALDYLTVATREAHVLAPAASETVQICGRDDDHMVVLAMAEGPGHYRINSRVGSRVPLNWVASGRLLVGHLSEKDRLEIFRRCATDSPTGRAPTDPRVLSRESREAFESRLSLQLSESDFAVACLASPIRDLDGACIATISFVGPEQRISDNIDSYGCMLRGAAQRIEHMLGWIHDDEPGE